MKTHIISETENQRIEILLPLHLTFLQYMPTTFTLSDWGANLLLTIVTKDLVKIGFRSKEEIKYCGVVPVLQAGTSIVLSSPFDIFENTFNELNQMENLSDIKNVEEHLNSLETNNDLYFYTKIFEKEIEKVKGYSVCKQNSLIYLIFFGYNSIQIGEIESVDWDFDLPT